MRIAEHGVKSWKKVLGGSKGWKKKKKKKKKREHFRKNRRELIYTIHELVEDAPDTSKI